MDAKLEARSPPCLAPAASVCIEQQQLIAQHLGAPTPKSVATSPEDVVLARILVASPKPRRRCLRFA